MKHTLFIGACVKVQGRQGLYIIDTLLTDGAELRGVVRHHKIKPTFCFILYHHLLPIPLDSGVLRSSGFKQKQTGYFNKKSLTIRIDKNLGPQWYVRGRPTEELPIPYYHQLQYLALLHKIELKRLIHEPSH